MTSNTPDQRAAVVYVQWLKITSSAVVIIILECFFCKTLFPSSSFNITKDKQLKFPPSFSKNFILHLVFLFTLWLPNILNCPPSMYKFYIKVSSLLPLFLPHPLGEMCDIFHLQFPPGNEGPQGRAQPLHHILLFT